MLMRYMQKFWLSTWPLWVLVAAWQVSALLVDKPLLLPQVPEVLITLAQMVTTMTFWQGVGTTVSGLFRGWFTALAVISVMLLGSLTSSTVRSFNDRVTSMLMPMPAISFLPIMMLIFGIGQQTIMVMVIWGTLWVTYHQFINNIDQARNRWQPQVRNLGLGHVDSLIYVYVPALAGSSLASLQISWSLAWRAQIALEIMFGAISTFNSIGSMMMDERANMDTPMVWSYMLVIMIIGIMMDRMFAAAKSRVTW